MCAKSLQLYLTVCDSMDCSHQAPLSMGFPGKNTGVGCCALLQGIFRTQGSNLHLLHWHTKFCFIYRIPPDLLPTDDHFFKRLDNFLQGKRFFNQQEAENAFLEFVKSQSTGCYAT